LLGEEEEKEEEEEGEAYRVAMNPCILG